MTVVNVVSSMQQKLKNVCIVPLPFPIKTPLVYIVECIFYALKTQCESCLLASAILAPWKTQRRWGADAATFPLGDANLAGGGPPHLKL